MSETQVEESTTEETNTPDEIEQLKQTLTLLQTENTKLKSIKNEIVKERDNLKSKIKETNVTQADADYKQLYTEQLKQNEEFKRQQKQLTINNSIKSKLSKSGVSEEKIDAALRLVDNKLIDYSTDEIDETGIEAATMTLKKDFGFLFEKTIEPTTVKTPGKVQAAQPKTITRSDWDATPISERPALLQSGYKII